MKHFRILLFTVQAIGSVSQCAEGITTPEQARAFLNERWWVLSTCYITPETSKEYLACCLAESKQAEQYYLKQAAMLYYNMQARDQYNYFAERAHKEQHAFELLLAQGSQEEMIKVFGKELVRLQREHFRAKLINELYKPVFWTQQEESCAKEIIALEQQLMAYAESPTS